MPTFAELSHGREHTHRLDCWCRPQVFLYCQLCEGMEGTSEGPEHCFMCKGARVFPMLATDRARLQLLVDENHDRPPLIVVHTNASADGLAIELTTHIILGHLTEDDDDDGDDTDEPASSWEQDPEAWKKKG